MGIVEGREVLEIIKKGVYKPPQFLKFYHTHFGNYFPGGRDFLWHGFSNSLRIHTLISTDFM